MRRLLHGSSYRHISRRESDGMKKAPKIRYNGNIALIHTREDIDVLMKAHNQMADIVNELINIVEKQEEIIKEMEGEKHENIYRGRSRNPIEFKNM